MDRESIGPVNGPPPDHPGYRTPGRPGDMRYLCHFCPWFTDVSPGGLTMTYLPGGQFFATAPHMDEIERRLEVHLAQHVDEMMAAVG